jgi:uncharacterized protein
VGQGLVRLDASTELVQEFLHVLLRRGVKRDQAVEEANEVRRLCRVVPFDDQVLALSLTMVRKYPGIGVRDSVHAATAVAGGINRILSADHVFDGMDEVERVDPGQAAGLLDV